MYTASSALCLIVALATTGEIASAADAAPIRYSVEAKLVSLPATEAKDLPASGLYSNQEMVNIVTRPRAQLSSFPSLSATLGESSSISLAQSMALPDGTTREVGPTLHVISHADAQQFSLKFREVRFLGYYGTHLENPNFESHTVYRSISSSAPSAPQFALVDVTDRHEPFTDANGRVMASIADANERQLLFVKITRG